MSRSYSRNLRDCVRISAPADLAVKAISAQRPPHAVVFAFYMSEPVIRTCVYVDGFNLYYRALKETRFRWLDLEVLSRQLLDAAHRIERIRYFTAPVSGKPDRATYTRQQTYLNALRANSKIEVHLGSFLTTIKSRPLVTPLADGTTHVRIVHMEEKGSDVNLATYLVHDAWADRFDTALLYSQDTDLLEPVRIVSHELKKPVGVVVLDGRKPGKLAQSADFVRQLTAARLAASQLPANVVFGNKGKIARRPPEWK
jgi:hypothetical protein